MPNKQGVLMESIWHDPDFRRLTRTAQVLYAQLLSQKELDRAGMQPLLPGKWAKGCEEVTEADIWRDLALLEERRFVFFDAETDECFVRSYMRRCGVAKHKYLFKNVVRCAGMVVSPKLRFELAKELRRLRRAEATRVANEIDPGPDFVNQTVKQTESPSDAHSMPIEPPSNGDRMPIAETMGIECPSNALGYGLRFGSRVDVLPVVSFKEGSKPPNRALRLDRADFVGPDGKQGSENSLGERLPAPRRLDPRQGPH
jgi:hypothetical protein